MFKDGCLCVSLEFNLLCSSLLRAHGPVERKKERINCVQHLHKSIY